MSSHGKGQGHPTPVPDRYRHIDLRQSCVGVSRGNEIAEAPGADGLEVSWSFCFGVSAACAAATANCLILVRNDRRVRHCSIRMRNERYDKCQGNHYCYLFHDRHFGC